MSAQAFGSQDTCIDKQLERFRDVAADISLFESSRSILLFKLLKDIWTSSNNASVFKGMDLVMFGRLPSKEAGLL